jgi:hypothetical protein
VVSFPRMMRTRSGLGEVRYALGNRLVDRYLEFVAGRARPNTLRAVAFDLKAFFTVIGKDPVLVTAADVFEFLADQRGASRRTVAFRLPSSTIRKSILCTTAHERRNSRGGADRRIFRAACRGAT